MVLRSLGACVLIAAVTTGGATASDPREVVPRFSLGARTAAADDEVALRVARTPRLPQREIRLYLVPTDVAASVRSRFNSRLSFIGTVRASRHARLVFTLPPLEAGSYALAYWCRGCLARGKGIGVQASPELRVNRPSGEGCLTTVPNGSTPPGLKSLPQHHGNGMLWALLPGDGVYRDRPESDGTFFEKIPWFAAGISGELKVSARRLDASGQSPRTQAVPGWPEGFRGSGSWASRVWFTSEGCWKVTGRIRDVSLSFIVGVAST